MISTPSRYFALLRHRDFALLWSGQTVSMLGDGVLTVVLALETLRIDRNPIGLSYVLAARLVPAVVFVLLGGVIVDRVPRRLAMLSSDLVRGAAVAVIAILVATGEINLLTLIAMAFVFGLADAFFFPAATAITPELLPAGLLLGASALSNTSLQLARILIGPAIGGMIVGLLGAAWGFGIDAASFVVSASCLAALTVRSQPTASERTESPLHGILEGLRYCRSQRWLWVSILGTALGNVVAFSPLGVLIPLLVEHSLHGGAVALGLVLASGGAGGVAAGWPSRASSATSFAPVVGLGPVRTRSALGLGFVPDVWLGGGVAFVTYGLDAFGSVFWNPLVQQAVPPVMIGRVSSLDYFFSFALSPLGLVVAGAAAEGIGVRPTLVIGGAITALTALIPLLPGVDDPQSPEPAVDQPLA